MTEHKSTNITWHEGIDRAERYQSLHATGATIWFTGLSGSGKSTIASALESELVRGGVFAYRLDGDNIRYGLSKNLGFSHEDRTENIRRIGEVCRLFSDAGVIAVASFISPYKEDRDAVRALHKELGLQFFEVFVDTPVEECEKRDPKGLYAKARAGEIQGFTGINAPYEAPENAEMVIDTTKTSVQEAVTRCRAMLESSGSGRPRWGRRGYD